MKLIKSFNINTDDMSALAQTRSILISGDKDAVFDLRVTTAGGKFYDFTDNTFKSTETSACRLANQVLSTYVFNKEINFPADAEKYTVELTADPHFNTRLQDNIGNDTSNHVRATSIINQVANTSILFDLTGTAANFTSATLDQVVTVTKSPTDLSTTTTDINWTISNATTDAKGFGLIPKNPPLEMRKDTSDNFFKVDISDAFWYTQTTVTINDTKSDDGGGSSHYNYLVDKISHLSTGMIVSGVSTGSLSGTPSLSRVHLVKDRASDNFGKPMLKFSAAQVFANGTVLTIKAYGFNKIKQVTGINLNTESMKLTQTPLTKTVRTDSSSSTTLALNGTYGLSKGAYIEAYGVNNSSNNPIAQISDPDASGGEILLTVAQSLAAGTVLNIIGSSNSYTLKGSITMDTFPSSNKTIYFDLGKILSLGTNA
jgi:hypothetical protein